MLARFEDFQFQSEGGASVERVGSFKYLGVTADDKWSRKVHLRSLFRKLGHRLTMFNRIRHVLDRKTRVAYFNGLVLPHRLRRYYLRGPTRLKSRNEPTSGFPKPFCEEN